MNSQVAPALRQLWHGFTEPAVILYRLVRQRRFRVLLPVLVVSGLMVTFVHSWSLSQFGSFFFVLPTLLAAVVSGGIAALDARSKGRTISASRREIALRSLGGLPTTLVLLILTGLAAVLLVVVALVGAVGWIAFKILRGSGSGPVKTRRTLSSASVGDLIWAEIANSQDPGSKVRPCIVVRKSFGSADVLYCTSQPKKGDPRYLQLMVDFGTGKDNFVNLRDVRTIGDREFDHTVGPLPADVFRLVTRSAGI